MDPEEILGPEGGLPIGDPNPLPSGFVQPIGPPADEGATGDPTSDWDGVVAARPNSAGDDREQGPVRDIFTLGLAAPVKAPHPAGDGRKQQP